MYHLRRLQGIIPDAKLGTELCGQFSPQAKSRVPRAVLGLWTSCGYPVGKLWTPCGQPVDSFRYVITSQGVAGDTGRVLL